MREILFRAKRTDNKDWIEGIPFRFEEDEDVIKYVMLIDDAENILRPPYTSLSYATAEIYAKEIDPETVCQYTGMTDKNGKKIFEGDILELGFSEYFEVWWNYDSASFTISNDSESKGFDDCYMCEIEVVGNIFDNPQLSKESEDEYETK